MLELSEPLQTAVEQQTEPVEVIDPRTQVRYLLVRAEVFDHLRELAYDDSPWTDQVEVTSERPASEDWSRP